MEITIKDKRLDKIEVLGSPIVPIFSEEPSNPK
jgi:hypothetical protein